MEPVEKEGGGDEGLRILSWNINGIRSLNNFPEILNGLAADIVCLQETKVTREMLTENIALIPGWSSYYAFSKIKGGYSGVATYCRSRATPVAAEEGLTGCLAGLPEGDRAGDDWHHKVRMEFPPDVIKSLDTEGRCVVTRHQLQTDSQEPNYLVIFNLYCPRADPEREDRKKFKLDFYKALDIRANAFKARGYHVIVLGDVNTSHREIDHCDPYEEFQDHPGRRFLDHFLLSEKCEEETCESPEKQSSSDCDAAPDGWQCSYLTLPGHQFFDSFRHLHPDRKLAFTCWNTKMNCRSTNYGTRIDYILPSLPLSGALLAADIHPEIEGSDHCPVSATLDLIVRPSQKLPSWATKNFPEFQGKQLSIKEMFSRPQPNSQKRNGPEPCVTNNGGSSQPRGGFGAKKQKTANTAKITSFFANKSQTTAKVTPEQKYDSQTGPALTGNSNSSSNRNSNNNQSSSVAGLCWDPEKRKNSAAAWGALFKPPPPAPLCTKHKEEAVKRKVNKKGPNQGREFYCCGRGEGRADDPLARCDFFKWA